MSRFLNNSYNALEAYIPGEQPQDKKYIKLNTNESPFSPSDGVLRTVNKNETENLRLYPDPQCRVLKNKIAGLYDVKPENIYLAGGSDDILNFAFMAFGKDGVVFPDITYGFYTVFAKLHGLAETQIPLNNDFTLDVNAYCGKNKMIVIANPNAPTGICLPVSEIEKIIRSNPDNIVLVDEAYVDFGGESCIPLTKRYDNLLVVQTFSKSRSMAGARLGFSVASAEITADLEKFKYSTNPYNINRLTQAAGAAAIDDHDYYIGNCRKIIENRAYTAEELKKLGFSVLPSKANFVFAEAEWISGEKLYNELKTRGVLVRHFKGGRIANFNRITIGSKTEMDVFLKTVKEIKEQQI